MRLELNEASFSYSKDKTILKQANLDLDQGQIMSLLGPNGCGKTTLLKCLIGILEFDSGILRLDNKIINKNRTRYFGYVPQISSSPAPYSTRQMVLLGRSRFIGTFSKPAQEDYARVDETLNLVGITPLADRAFNSLSGGEKQLALICRALVSEAEILVFDEPTSALDLINQHNTIDLMNRLSKDFGFSIIFSTHNPSHALHISDKTLLLDKSGKSVFGTTEQMINEENMNKLFGVRTRIIEIDDLGASYRGVIPIPDSLSEKDDKRQRIESFHSGTLARLRSNHE